MKFFDYYIGFLAMVFSFCYCNIAGLIIQPNMPLENWIFINVVATCMGLFLFFLWTVCRDMENMRR